MGLCVFLGGTMFYSRSALSCPGLLREGSHGLSHSFPGVFRERFVNPMSKTIQSCQKHNFSSSCALRSRPGAPAWRLSPSSDSRELCQSSYTFSSTAASRSPFAAPVISPLTRSQKTRKGLDKQQQKQNQIK